MTEYKDLCDWCDNMEYNSDFEYSCDSCDWEGEEPIFIPSECDVDEEGYPIGDFWWIPICPNCKAVLQQEVF